MKRGEKKRSEKLQGVGTFSKDPIARSAPEISAAAPLAWHHIQPSCIGSTSSVYTGKSMFSCISVLPARNTCIIHIEQFVDRHIPSIKH